jgi:peptidoglycan-associated lipoprotein
MDIVMLPVFFDFDKYDIRSDAEQTLQNNLKWFEIYPVQRVRIEASCDMRGSVSYNQRLAMKRADAVRQWLIDHGVDGNLLVPTVFGKVNSFDNATTESGYQMNRRVQFVPAR